ncbi:hypothetical protein [Ensifer sp. SL37]|uniref:hypothetical protein n=1 Tax=Ensifer sp. SL37 TaxID=2995137 RepID=UPI002272B844|nr:hypothetical protein [Ensifer sp. SL37]MCY1740695.1 hypothetical protein [Ensifer sp. SL37]
MNSLVHFAGSAALSAVLLACVTPARAASVNECAIWICLPGGFPSGCEAAYAAMISRLKNLEPPLPEFSGCSADGDDNGMSFDWGKAAYIEERHVCTSSTIGLNEKSECRDDPARHVKGEVCRRRTSRPDARPAGCIRTDDYITVYQNGKALSPITYWNIR